MSKLVVIVGVTGKQGGSVARRFLEDPQYTVRGITRNSASPASQRLAAAGVEIVTADLNNAESLIPAFAGANSIFSVTDYWQTISNEEAHRHCAATGTRIIDRAYQVEVTQGINIAQAAARTADTLDEMGFIASTLSHADKITSGKINPQQFTAKAKVFPKYVTTHLPQLAAKMSCVQTGYFMISWKNAPPFFVTKVDNDKWEMSFTTHPNTPVPHLDVHADLGNIVYAISKLLPGGDYLAAGTTCSWIEYMCLWPKVTGKASTYRQVDREQFVKKYFGQFPDIGQEVADMYEYFSDASQQEELKSLITPEDIRKKGVECPTTSLEQWMKAEDWSAYFDTAA